MKAFKRKISKNSRETKSSIDHEKALGFYNKACQGHTGMCVAGSILLDVYFDFTWNIEYRDLILGEKRVEKDFLLINIKFIINLLILLY